MQDEINQKIVALVIRVVTKAGELTKREFDEAMNIADKRFQQAGETYKKAKQQKKEKAAQPKSGKQTVGELMMQNQGLTNIEITDSNIKSFEKTANKYNIDFALMKEKDSQPPKYVVFFKARDVDVMTAAFKEYTAKELNRSKKPSVKKKLEKAKQKAEQKAAKKEKSRQKSRQKEKTRTRSRGLER